MLAEGEGAREGKGVKREASRDAFHVRFSSLASLGFRLEGVG
jgi:hypothetical protein